MAHGASPPMHNPTENNEFKAVMHTCFVARLVKDQKELLVLVPQLRLLRCESAHLIQQLGVVCNCLL